MKYEKILFQSLAALSLFIFIILYGHGLLSKNESFGLGLGYVMLSVMFLGLSIISSILSMLAPSHTDFKGSRG